MPLERKSAAGLVVILAAPYVDDLSVFVRVAIDRPNAVARLFMLFEIEQGADSIPVCIVILGRYVLKDELAGRAVIKQMADVADDVAVFVNACGTKIARGAKANDEIVEADRRCGSVVCKCRSWANAQCRGFGQACKWRQRRESKAQRKCSAADGVVFGHNFSIRRVRLCDSFGHYTAQMFKDAGLIVCAAQ